MFKKLLLAFALTLSITNVNAKVIEQTQTAANLNLKYPLVYVDNPIAQKSINTDIAVHVDKMRDLYYNKKMYKVNQWYKVTYEDDNVLSIVITSDWYNGRGVHGYHIKQGLVYDKNTGTRIPAYNYVKFKNDAQLKDLVGSGIVHVYNESGEKRVYPRDMFGLKNIKVKNDNYALTGDGSLVMLYQPYELSMYANGVNMLLLEPNNIEYINRWNS